jgi:hypothetical protein
MEELKMKKDNSWLFRGQQDICKSTCPKCNAISLVDARIGACFGDVDKRFAQHPCDEERAKDIIAYCKKNGLSANELKKIILGFLHSNLNNANIIENNYNEAIKFLKSRKFA